MKRFSKQFFIVGIVSLLIFPAATDLATAPTSQTPRPFTAQELDRFLLDVPEFVKWQTVLHQHLANNQKLDKKQLGNDLHARLRLSPERFFYILGRIQEAIALTFSEASLDARQKAGRAGDAFSAGVSPEQREAMRKQIQEKLKTIPPEELQLIESRLDEILKCGLGRHVGLGAPSR